MLSIIILLQIIVNKCIGDVQKQNTIIN